MLNKMKLFYNFFKRYCRFTIMIKPAEKILDDKIYTN